VAEFFKEGYGSKRAVLPMMMMAAGFLSFASALLSISMLFYTVNQSESYFSSGNKV
jgi:hypothetical protein